LRGEVQTTLHGRQSHVHDGRVQDHHELGQG
jgi:hypothetical protein